MKLITNWAIVGENRIRIFNNEVIETSTKIKPVIFQDGDVIFVLYSKDCRYTLKVFRFYNLFDSSISISTRLWKDKTPIEIVKELDRKLCS